MEYFKRTTVQAPQQPLSAKKAQDILSLLKAGWDETTIFQSPKGREVGFGHLTYHIEEVKKEFLKVKDEVYKKVKGQFVLEPEIPPVVDEEGKEVTPVVPQKVYEVTTKTALQDSLGVSKLEAVDVLNTVVAFDENPEEPLTYIQFVAKYKPVKVVVEAIEK
jgi:hypothetical protein